MVGANRLHTSGGQVPIPILVAVLRGWGFETGVFSPLRQGIVAIPLSLAGILGWGIETGEFSPLRQGILP